MAFRHFFHSGVGNYITKTLKDSATVSIAAGGNGVAIINIPKNEIWLIKQINITKGADVTVSSISIDGEVIPDLASVDLEATYGDLITARSSISVSGSNAGAAAEDLTIEVVGVKLVLVESP